MQGKEMGGDMKKHQRSEINKLSEKEEGYMYKQKKWRNTGFVYYKWRYANSIGKEVGWRAETERQRTETETEIDNIRGCATRKKKYNKDKVKE